MSRLEGSLHPGLVGLNGGWGVGNAAGWQVARYIESPVRRKPREVMRWYWSLKLASRATWISSLSKPAHRPMRSRFSITPTSSRPELRTSVFPPASAKISGCWLRTWETASSTSFWKFAPSAGQLPMSLVWMGSFAQLLAPGKVGVGAGVGVATVTGAGVGELTAVGV